MFCKQAAAKLLSLILLSGIHLLALNLSVPAQEGAEARQSGAALTILDSNRERDGLIGPVRRVRTETARLSSHSGKSVEGPRALLEMTTYDLKGDRVDNAYYPVAGSFLTGKEEYKYDDHGNVVEMTLRGSDGSILSRETYTYEFDAIGNWTKMVTSVVVFEGGRLSHEPTEVTYRTITYYFDETIAKIVKPTSTHAAAHAASSAANTVDQVETGSRLPADGETASKTDVPDKRRSAVLPAITALDKLGLLIGPVGTEVVPATSAASPAIKLIAASEDAPAWSATAPTAGANDTPLAKTETEAAKSMTPLTPPAASIPAHPKDSQVEVKVSSTEPPKTNSTTNISSDAAVKSNSAPTLGMPFAEAVEYNKAGLSHYEAGRYREAAEAYERASALAPADALTYNNLGTAYSALGRFKEAVEAYKQAARLQPEVAEVHVNLGNAYYQLKKHAEAMKEFKLAISLQPLNVEAHYGLGLANYGLHRYREAIEAFKRAIQLEPERAEGHYAIALSYQEVKDTESLMNHYRILQRLDKELARSLAETFPTIEMPCRHPPCR